MVSPRKELYYTKGSVDNKNLQDNMKIYQYSSSYSTTLFAISMPPSGCLCKTPVYNLLSLNTMLYWT
jgi:hypothetical protein